MITNVVLKFKCIIICLCISFIVCHWRCWTSY